MVGGAVFYLGLVLGVLSGVAKLAPLLHHSCTAIEVIAVQKAQVARLAGAEQVQLLRQKSTQRLMRS